MSVTAKDIAKHLNLSQPTVSRILSGDARHRISSETRQRVLDAARMMNYRPNAIARSLRRGRTNAIGFYTNYAYNARNEFQGTVIGALQEYCESLCFDLMLFSTLHDRPAQEMYAKLRDGRVDGLILHATIDDPLVEIFETCTMPVVAIADPLPLTAVMSDDIGGMREVIDFLWARGYEHFVYLAPDRTLASVERRRIAFEEDLASRNVPEESRLVKRIFWEILGDSLDWLLAAGRRTAVCCWNDRTAYNLLTACLERGVQVPERIAIVGFDGFVSTKAPARQLTTVECPWDAVVSTGMDILMEMVNGEHFAPANGPLHVTLPVKLLKGDTA